MKTLCKASLFFLLLLSFNACDEVDELTDFEVTDSISETQAVDISSDLGDSIQVSVDETIDITSISEINNNREFIESVSINSIDYSFSNFNGNVAAELTELKFSSNGIVVELENVMVKTAVDNNTRFSITDQEKLTQFSNLLNSDRTEITYTFSGILNGTPVRFDVNFEIALTVSIDPV